MGISNHASKYMEWEPKYNWETCKTNRREFGEFIAHFLTADSRVINLDGIYGSGKTEFIRRLYIELAKKNHPVVYIDIWESDFSINPLAVICSELLQQIEFILKEKCPSGEIENKNKATETFNKLKAKLGICLHYATLVSLIGGDNSISTEISSVNAAVSAIPNLVTESKSKKYVETIQKNHVDAVQAMKEIKEYITYISELIEVIYELNIPIVILIDELDRCRPTYAIETLEVIKHFFETKGCTFLVATNTDVLEHSVQAVYGSTFDAKHYLRRFFDRKVNLPQVSTVDYLKAKQLDFSKYTNNGINLHPIGSPDTILEVFAFLFKANNIELRGVEQIINRFFTSLDYALEIKQKSYTAINTVVLMVGLIEQHFDKLELSERKNNSPQGTTIKINGSLLRSTIDAMFNCVMTTESKTRYIGRGHSKEHAYVQQMLTIESHNFDNINIWGFSQDSINVFTEIIRQYNDPNCNFWLWESYQRVIELSGHIQ
ncbi:KAP family P-loop NTPase fold protein [Shewanella xiamenensis]|uniref:KAP family P-loop NTPase fold protein n=1 Tax=Shewanella xiamenensis TaxID=332186 RepID=UPI0004D52364|nr:P-loop NTPase fold protein [Shewanella xiamenensis]KEK26997.1 KAP P-loop domain-containing protein [Shewanella xiamenensis]MDL3984752.1 KAP family NTPase [Shewanella xiamenensis]